jgi:orotate phosphoribosyltransferase
VGARLTGKVLIIDDVISAGTSVRESIELIRSEGAIPCAVVIALDRKERGIGDLSAVQEVESNYGIPVIAIATLDDLLDYLRSETEMSENLSVVQAYRDLFGAR